MPTIRTETKRAAVVRAFGNIPVGSDNLNFLYARRHLATVKDGKWRDLKYVAEWDELDHAISKALAAIKPTIRKTLDRIRRRDGAKFAKEVAGRLADSVVG